MEDKTHTHTHTQSTNRCSIFQPTFSLLMLALFLHHQYLDSQLLTALDPTGIRIDLPIYVKIVDPGENNEGEGVNGHSPVFYPSGRFSWRDKLDNQ